jgi:hypothetical protein
MYLATCGIYRIISFIWSALLAQWYIVLIVHLTSGVRAPELSKPFCCDLHVFCRVDFSALRTSTACASLFMHSWEHKWHTYTYLHLHAHTCIYMHIHAHTFKYLQILTYIVCMCMYVHVLRVCVGMSLFVGIACMCRYCRYVQVCHYV